MTTIHDIDMKCYLCGETSSQPILGSTSCWGHPDLDLRPAAMQRSSMIAWILECPHCGYVSERLDSETPISMEFIKSNEYQNCENYDFKRPLAARFYKNYMICKETQNKSSEFTNLLHCAWACDDVEDILAVEIRLKAIEVVEQLIEADHENKINLMIIKADLMRRANLFSDLIKEYENISFDDELLNDIIKFQIEKAESSDNRCYTVEDVINEQEK